MSLQVLFRHIPALAMRLACSPAPSLFTAPEFDATLNVTTLRNYTSKKPTDMDFEWDDAKAALNLRKHGIAFEDAVYVFLHPWTNRHGR